MSSSGKPPVPGPKALDEADPLATVAALSPLATARLGWPERYVARSDGDGAYVYCLEAPEVRVRVERGSVSPPAAVRKAAEGTIFLDGAAQGEPLLDLERRVFNLDHHEGCVRAFTLATCEQALVLALRGWDLKERPWTILANEPDLDTVLAIWVLLNAHHVTEDPLVRQAIVPLIRLEGVIDAHGLELRDLVGFEERQLARVAARLDTLLEGESAVKRRGEWGEVDYLAFTAEQLGRIDRQVYPPGYFQDVSSVEELARVDVTANRVAVVCASEKGIYELEPELKKLYGKRLGVIALRKDDSTYTLRRVDPFLPTALETAYERLNRLDPSVREGDVGNRWGGSAEIGGSPRATGTGLLPAEIAWTLERSFRRPSWSTQAAGQALATVIAGLAAGLPFVAAFLLRGWPLPWSPGTLVPFAGGLALAAVALLWGVARRRPGLYGLRRPGGRDWLWTLPLAAGGGLLGGAWWLWPELLGEGGAGVGPGAQWAALLGLPIATEVLFRGVVHGLASRDAAVQHAGERWFPSVGVVVSAGLYAAATVILGLPTLASFAPVVPAVGRGVGALLVGMAAATARERSGSLLMAVVVQLVAAVSAQVAAVL